MEPKIRRKYKAVPDTLSQSTTEPRVYQIPDAPFGAGAIKVVAGQAAATAASRTVLIKS